jgi:hypothetical protein
MGKVHRQPFTFRPSTGIQTCDTQNENSVVLRIGHDRATKTMNRSWSESLQKLIVGEQHAQKHLHVCIESYASFCFGASNAQKYFLIFRFGVALPSFHDGRIAATDNC